MVQLGSKDVKETQELSHKKEFPSCRAQRQETETESVEIKETVIKDAKRCGTRGCDARG